MSARRLRARGRAAGPAALLLASSLGCPGGGESSAGSSSSSGAGASSEGSSGVTGSTSAAPTTGTGTSAGPTSSGPTVTSAATDEPTTGAPPACGAVETFAAGLSPTQQIHVSPAGADDAACGAEGAPCRTIAFAAGEATPGTAIVLHAGSHAADQYIDGLTGSADAPIWIGGAPGEAAQIVGGGEGLHLTRPRYVVVHDLEVTGASDNGVNVDDGGAYDDPEAARFVALERLRIHDIGQGGNQDCLKLSGVRDFWVLGSELSGCGGGGQGSGVDHVGCHRGLLVGNNFHDISGNAVQAKGGSEDLEIRANVMTNAGERAVNLGGSTGLEFFRPPLVMGGPNAEARRIAVIANAIVGGATPLAFVGCVDCLAANNPIVGPERWLLRILQETVSTPDYEFLPASMGRFVGNVVVFQRGQISTYVNIGADTAPETFVFQSNLWYASDDPGASSPAADLPSPEIDAIAGQDPLLLGPGDVHLGPGSPAIGSGAPLPELSADLDGECYAAPPSRGADEPVG